MFFMVHQYIIKQHDSSTKGLPDIFFVFTHGFIQIVKDLDEVGYINITSQICSYFLILTSFDNFVLNSFIFELNFQ